RNPPRDRVLDDREIVALWNACAGEGPAGQAVKLLFMTGCRENEGFGALLSEIDAAERLWRFPGQKNKNAHAHVGPLAPQTWAIIGAQPRFAGCDYISTTDGRRSIGGFSRLKSNLDRSMQPAAPWVLHDTRRTTASGMQRLGIRVEVIEQVLN